MGAGPGGGTGTSRVSAGPRGSSRAWGAAEAGEGQVLRGVGGGPGARLGEAWGTALAEMQAPAGPSGDAWRAEELWGIQC